MQMKHAVNKFIWYGNVWCVTIDNKFKISTLIHADKYTINYNGWYLIIYILKTGIVLTIDTCLLLKSYKNALIKKNIISVAADDNLYV